ncbi:uncharacterized protein LOC112552501 [Pogonomyrmex barbatus]|uniref:Uncharacterized protein LOC112552501 n=1 Tax=Pogonomyrmex barbatus TaxID=144034 RepID=A0A8N1S4E8_9HYME|nr:uncharacterized protein LOC112552501 [Pogonomyrmex barbatus]
MHTGYYIELPQEIMLKRAVINVQSTDNACFAWSVAALHSAERHTNRESSYPHYTTVLNLQDITFPMTFNQIKKFEHLNDFSINIYGIKGKEILPIHLTTKKMKKYANLLYMQDSRNDNVRHFAYIKNLSRLVSSQLSKKEHKKYFCDRCLHYFNSSDKLESHTVDCQRMNDCAIRLPNEDNKWLEFKNHCNKEQLPFIVYANLECILRRMEPERENTSYTYQQQGI